MEQPPQLTPQQNKNFMEGLRQEIPSLGAVAGKLVEIFRKDFTTETTSLSQIDDFEKRGAYEHFEKPADTRRSDVIQACIVLRRVFKQAMATTDRSATVKNKMLQVQKHDL